MSPSRQFCTQPHRHITPHQFQSLPKLAERAPATAVLELARASATAARAPANTQTHTHTHNCTRGRCQHATSCQDCAQVHIAQRTISSDTRRATDIAATRRGCVTAMHRPPASPSSSRYCGSCVVLPAHQPIVSPSMRKRTNTQQTHQPVVHFSQRNTSRSSSASPTTQQHSTRHHRARVTWLQLAAPEPVSPTQTTTRFVRRATSSSPRTSYMGSDSRAALGPPGRHTSARARTCGHTRPSDHRGARGACVRPHAPRATTPARG